MTQSAKMDDVTGTENRQELEKGNWKGALWLAEDSNYVSKVTRIGNQQEREKVAGQMKSQYWKTPLKASCQKASVKKLRQDGKEELDIRRKHEQLEKQG